MAWPARLVWNRRLVALDRQQLGSRLSYDLDGAKEPGLDGVYFVPFDEFKHRQQRDRNLGPGCSLREEVVEGHPAGGDDSPAKQLDLILDGNGPLFHSHRDAVFLKVGPVIG